VQTAHSTFLGDTIPSPEFGVGAGLLAEGFLSLDEETDHRFLRGIFGRAWSDVLKLWPAQAFV